MPLEILTGTDVPALMARAQQMLGDDAVVVSVRRIVDGRRLAFELVAADPVTAERQHREDEARRAREAAPAAATAVLMAQQARAAQVAHTAPSAHAATQDAFPRTPAERYGKAEPAAAQPARHAQSRRDALQQAPPSFWDLEEAPTSEAPTSELPTSQARAPGKPAPATPRRPKAPRLAWPFKSAPARREKRRPRVIALVGPTGAGKTTTIAKLANHPLAFAGQRVGLICLDTYRIGAVEQSKQYAELSKMPLEVVWDAGDVAHAMKRLRDCDVILVDTPGRGPRASADLRDTQARLLELTPDEVHMVLPAGLQPALARRVVSAHLALGVTHLLATKLDEFPDERGVFELAAQFALPMRWLTDGQEVPRDLQSAPQVTRTSTNGLEQLLEAGAR
jgi:flagellar biosynthesis protein FlhF